MKKGDMLKSNSFGDFEIVELLKGGKVLIRFTDTGFEKICSKQHAKEGKIRDSSKEGFTLKYKVGQIFETKNRGKYEIIEILPKSKVRVRFVETSYETDVNIKHISSGNIYDPYHRAICGVAFIGQGCYRPTRNGKTSKIYQTWRNMIARCYDESTRASKNYYERGVTVCDDWLNFQNFAKWYDERYKEGFVLDKDLTEIGSKVYSPDTCSLVPEHINNILIKQRTSGSKLPTGVRGCKGQYYAYISKRTTVEQLGPFCSKDEASDAYKMSKENYVKEIATEYYDKGEISQTIYENLMNWRVES